MQKAEHSQKIREAIIKKVQEIDKVETLKFDNQFLIFLCTCIENGVEIKLDKKELALDIFNHIFELSPDDKVIISRSIDFLCDNGMIKKINSIKKWSRITSNWVSRHL